MRRLKPGAAGWLATGAVILVAELADQRTMSDAFYAFSRDPRGRYVMLPAWAFLTAHLFGAIPKKYDPLCQLWIHVKGQAVELPAEPVVEIFLPDKGDAGRRLLLEALLRRGADKRGNSDIGEPR